MNSSRTEKIELAKALIEKERRIAQNPLKYAQQHPKQQEVSRVRKAIRALFWGNRVGKTEWGAQETAKVLLGEHEWIQPGEVWSFCPSFDEQKDTTQKKLLKYIPEHRIKDKTWLRKGIIKELVIDAGNGRTSKIAFKSYEQGREKAQGAGKVLIWFDEEPPHDIWEECFVRTEAGVQLHIILTMTAIKGMTWVYNDIYLNTSNPDIFVSEAGWDDNPWLTEDQKAQMGRGLTPQALKVRREGKFVKMVGLVCSWFGRSTHVVDIKELPPGDTYFAIDFGFSAPSAGLWVRIDREFNWWIFDGFYRKQLTNPQIQAIIRLKEQNLGRVIRIGDSAQASDIKQMNDAGISITGVEKAPGTNKENWDEWRARLMEEQGHILEATGKPKLFISSKLVDFDEEGNEFNFLVKEIENLRWEEIKTDMGIEQKPMWGKQAKHAIDALSYILATINKPKKEEAPAQAYTGAVKPFYPNIGV
ncbi:MAG TPA: terminase family protein [Blastocatellia bacterium]|nr:terminase family protein [Blastocatellia bacterium]